MNEIDDIIDDLYNGEAIPEDIQNQIKQALKLQELVKEKITLRTALKKPSYINKSYTYNDVLDHEIRVLQYILEESEKYKLTTRVLPSHKSMPNNFYPMK